MLKRTHGLSLVETLLALFVLQLAVIFVVSLVESNLTYQKDNRMRSQALRLARRTLADVRVWAADPANYLGNWSAWNGLRFSEGAHQITVEADPVGRDLLSPCQLLEEPYVAVAREKRMPRGVVPVRVTAAWGSRSVTLNSLIREPRREVVGGVEISPTTLAPLSPGESVVLSALVRDVANRPIEGLVFDWAVNAIDGNGTLTRAGHPRDRRSITLTNTYQLTTGVGVVPGELEIACWTYYHGQKIEGTVGPIRMLP